MTKMILIILACFISGCATTQPQIVDIPKIQPSAEIMKDCEDFILPSGPSLSDFGNSLKQNKKIYELCKSQNEAKKKFINDISK